MLLLSSFYYLYFVVIYFLQGSMFFKTVCYPYIPCPQCKSANDIDYRFCKSCGLQRSVQATQNVLTEDGRCMNQSTLRLIDDRIKYLDSLLDSSCYSKRKDNLKTELSKFLCDMGSQKTLYTAVPEDLRKFIIMKEKGGRTQLHDTSCRFKGLAGKQTCACPKTLAAKSVDSLIGKMRAIFRDLGRIGDWNPISSTGNPASSLSMKRHLQSVTIEQTSASVTSKQAVPLMFDKLGKLCRYLSYQTSVEKEPVAKLLLLRDKAYFSLLCHSGNRGGDLGLLTADRLFQLPDTDGIFISEVAGKTASIDNPKNAVILPSKDSDICPIKHLRKYFDFADESDSQLHNGYIFRLQHLGWTSKQMLDHYATIGGLCSPKGAASVLSDAADNQSMRNRNLDKFQEHFTV